MFLLLAVFVLFCVLLYKFAIYALPAAIGVAIGYWALTSGAGVPGGIFAGIVSGVVVFLIGRRAFAASRTPLARSVVAGIFVVPALWAGYSIVFQLAEGTGTTSSLWRHVLAVVGACLIGYVAFSRLAAPSGLRAYAAWQPRILPK